jgi:hypothetical protein
LKLSNSESGCEVAVLQLMLNQRQPTVSCRSAKKKNVCFPAFYSVSNLCFTVGNRAAVQNCLSARGQLKSTIFAHP